jgi:hypothetical protein
MGSGVILLTRTNAKVGDLLYVINKLKKVGINKIRGVNTDIDFHPHKDYEPCYCVEVWMEGGDDEVSLDDLQRIFYDYIQAPLPFLTRAIKVRGVIVEPAFFP